MATDEVRDAAIPETSRTFASLPKRGVAMQTVEAIKQMIVRGQLRPAQALPAERELASALNISRPTLREAIGALTAMNILESRHGDGTFVTNLTPLLLSEPISFLLQVDQESRTYLFEVRGMLEADASGLAAERISRSELKDLHALVAQGAVAIGDDAEFARLDDAFHAGIVDAARNPLFRSLYDSVVALSVQGQLSFARSTSDRVQAHEDHQAILKAIGRGSPAAARRAMLVHIAHIEEAIGSAPAGALEPEREEA
jgi:DNA-binding FadR family transcriptional regulator